MSVSHSALLWYDLAHLVAQRDCIVWHPEALVTVKHLFRTHLLGHWATGESDPRLLMTNSPIPNRR